MKKLWVFLLVTLVSVQVFAGQKLPILTYGDYSPVEVERFAKGVSSKAKQFKTILLSKTGESSIESLFQKVTVKTITLEAGDYDNSCFNTTTQKIEFFLGKQFTGKVAVYNNGNEEIILYKCACANILNARSTSVVNNGGLIDEDLPYQATTQTQQTQSTQPVVVVQQQPQVIVVRGSSYSYGGGYYGGGYSVGYGSYRNYSRPVVMPVVINNKVYNNNTGYSNSSYRRSSGYSTGYSSGYSSSSYRGTMSGGSSGYSSGSISSGRGTMSGGSSSGSSRSGGGVGRSR